MDSASGIGESHLAIEVGSVLRSHLESEQNLRRPIDGVSPQQRTGSIASVDLPRLTDFVSDVLGNLADVSHCSNT